MFRQAHGLQRFAIVQAEEPAVIGRHQTLHRRDELEHPG